MNYTISLACAKGTSQLCDIEAQQLGLTDIKTTPTLVRGRGDLQTLYRLCLWSRTASRVLVELAHDGIKNVDDLYQLAKSVEWEDTFAPDSTFIIRFSGTGYGIRDTQFGALKVKDAIVDRFRDANLPRPNIDKDAPDLKIDAHLHKGQLTIALDVSGAIHQRGYRTAHGVAPIRENLAAAMVMRANWDGQSPLIDPVCGSGTLLIEAGLIAADIAPALNRERFGFEHWFDHIPKQWQTILAEAKQRAESGRDQLTAPMIGFEADSNTLKLANENIARAGLSGKIQLHHNELSRFTYKAGFGEQGLLVCNPPYGARLGEARNIGALYDRLGQAFKTLPAGWRMAVISGLADTPRHLHLRADKTYSLPNGPIDAKVYLFSREAKTDKTERKAAAPEQIELSGEVLMFANRLKKNLKTLGKQAQKRDIHAYRLYDADIPEYGLAVDVYEDIERGKHLSVQLYDPPRSVSESDANRRNNEAIKALSAVLEIPRHKIFIKKRERQKGTSQYDRQTQKNVRQQQKIDIQDSTTSNQRGQQRGQLRVREGQGVFAINLADYLDTGLFLDHRLMRERMAREAKGKRVLNLFCYTSSVGVHSALGQAQQTTNVDLSQNYLDWSKRNYHLNGIAGIDDKHRFIKADVMAWIADTDEQFDLIFCDPPTFSNTKKTGRVFDVQTAHVELIDNCMARLSQGGVLYFSNNFRKFKLDEDLQEKYAVRLLNDTIDFDFKRRGNIHRVWAVRNNE